MIFGQCAQNKERVLWLDAILFHPDLVLAVHAMARKKVRNIRWSFQAARKQRMIELALKIAVNIHLRAQRIDQHPPGIVVEKKRHVLRFFRDLHPLAVLSLSPQFPRNRPMQVALPAGERGNDGVRTGRQAAHFHQAHGSAANLRFGCVLNQPLSL